MHARRVLGWSGWKFALAVRSYDHVKSDRLSEQCLFYLGPQDGQGAIPRDARHDVDPWVGPDECRRNYPVGTNANRRQLRVLGFHRLVRWHRSVMASDDPDAMTTKEGCTCTLNCEEVLCWSCWLPRANQATKEFPRRHPAIRRLRRHR